LGLPFKNKRKEREYRKKYMRKYREKEAQKKQAVRRALQRGDVLGAMKAMDRKPNIHIKKKGKRRH
jgi:hypothetical protein